VNIDSGAAFGGPLSVVVIEGRSAFLLTKDGRQELEPVTVAQ
jgi:serine/threonine protein phosphatase 1